MSSQPAPAPAGTPPGPVAGNPVVPPSATPPINLVLVAVARVRWRLRAQAALQGVVYGLLGGALILLGAVLLWRTGLLTPTALRLAGAAAGLLAVGGVLAGALRRLDPLRIAAQIDRSHHLHDRLASALQFAGAGRAPPPTLIAAQEALRRLAIADAERAAGAVQPALAAPWQRPARLGWLGLSLLSLLLAWRLQLPRPPGPAKVTPPKPQSLAEPRLFIDPELLGPEKDELRELLAKAEQQGDTEAAAILRQMQQLLEQVERGELSRQEAFERLAELERRLMQAGDGSLEDLKERLRKAGSELGEAKLSSELGRALVKEDLDKAQQELKQLAAAARARAPGDQPQREALAQALERAAQALRAEKPSQPPRSDEKSPDSPKDQWQDKTRAEAETHRIQELKDEERRLKKQQQEHPGDEEIERRLKKTQRELEQLEREKQEREETRRELEQLERDMQQAAEELRKQVEKMSPEQRKAFEKMVDDLKRMQQQMQKMQQGGPGQQGQQGQGQGRQQLRKQTTIALGSIKQVLRRIARSDGQGQQGQGQQGQGQGQQGPGQGQQGQGQGQAMKDFMNRAKGQGSDSDVLVEGEGGGQDGQKVMLLGEGSDPVLIPGLGAGSPGGNEGGQQGLGQGGERPGSEHDPNHLGAPTQLDSRRRLTKVSGKQGAGPTRSETILGAAQRGFAAQPYRQVYRDYSAVSEQVMSQQRVPPGYRFYVKRYFQMIKPRE